MMDKSWMVNDYPEAPEKDETEITIIAEIKASDIFPETWDKEEIESYVRGNIKDYLRDGEIEVREIEV